MNRRFELPQPKASSEDEVELRRYCAADEQQVILAAQESAKDLLPWMAWYHDGYKAEVAQWIELTLQGHATGSMYEFGIFDPRGGYLGACGLNQINRAAGVSNLGYWVRTSAAGRGIAVSAVRQLVAWAFANTSLNRLEIVVAEANLRSRRVAEKSGAQFDALLAQRLIVSKVPCSAALYSFVRQQ